MTTSYESAGGDHASRQADRFARILKWDIRYVNLAAHTSSWSKDPAAQVGCVITNAEETRIVSTGFNGLPRRVKDTAERLDNKKQKFAMVIHAEQNALIRAGREAEGANVYVYGRPVCNHCASLLVQANVDRVIALRPDPISDEEWHWKGRIALEMFVEAGIRFTEIQPEWLSPEILSLRRLEK